MKKPSYNEKVVAITKKILGWKLIPTKQTHPEIKPIRYDEWHIDESLVISQEIVREITHYTFAPLDSDKDIMMLWDKFSETHLSYLCGNTGNNNWLAGWTDENQQDHDFENSVRRWAMIDAMYGAIIQEPTKQENENDGK